MNQRDPHILDLAGPEPDRVIRYADGPTGIVDVYEPAAQDAGGGLVVLIHGGFWRAAYDRTHLRVLAAAIAATGSRVALPEYRRIGDDGGGWPGTLDDILEVVVSVPGHLGSHLDDTVLVGHSAGGHLAMLAAQRAERPPRGVVSLAGVLDLAAAHRDGLSRGVVAELLAARGPTAEAIADADPMARSVPAGAVRLIHGSDDTEVPPRYSVDYAARDARVGLELLPGIDHYDLIDPRSSAFDSLLRAIG